MADDKVSFELVSPERLLIDDQVDMVVVPGSEGDFGVLPGHTPFVSTIRPGVIDVHDGGNVRDRIFVAGGFAEVTPERCTVLAEDAVPVGDIDRTVLESRLRDLREDLGDAKSDEERAAVEQAIATTEAMMAAAAS